MSQTEGKAALLHKLEVPPSSCLLLLRPTIADITRVYVHINKDNFPFKSKHQIILRKGHALTNRIAKCYNEQGYHIVRKQTLAEISKKVWIVKGRGLVKKVSVVRIDIRKPAFYNMGVDYFGPIVTKQH